MDRKGRCYAVGPCHFIENLTLLFASLETVKAVNELHVYWKR